jgi:hypothetical protein
MPIRTRENQYRGVNAHLHSFLQNEPGGWWVVFHTAHIALLRTAIDLLLPAGYYVLSEKSLQIRGEDLPEGKLSRPRPDVSIFSSGQNQLTGTFIADSPFVTVSALETLSEEDELQSVVIYRVEEEGKLVPVTRIELLSPSNKPPYGEFRQYLNKRDETIRSEINLVEIDYLHQTPSPLWIIPDYTRNYPDSYPYTIAVTDVRESLQQGLTYVYVTNADQLLPTITVPLLNADAVGLNLGSVYDQTFRENRFYGEIAVDYEALPMNFDSYSEDDQARIRAVMERVKAKLAPPPPPA